MTAFAKTIPVLDTSKPSIKQKGYSIIELSIALAIISIILVTALAGVQRILRSNNVNEDLKNINLVASKLAVMLSSVPNTAGTARLFCARACNSIRLKPVTLWLKFSTNSPRAKPSFWTWAAPTSKSSATSAAVCQRLFSESKKANSYPTP